MMRLASISYLLTVYLLILLATTGCIHTYPKGEPDNPHLLSVTLELSIDPSLTQQRESGNTDAQFTHLRALILIEQNGRTVCRQEQSLLLNTNTYAPIETSVSLPTSLTPSLYDLTVWVDAIDPSNGSPLHYDTSDLSSISIMPYWESLAYTPAKGVTPICAFYSDKLDLRGYKDEWHGSVKHSIVLPTPVGILSFVATDVETLLRHYPDAASTIGYSAEIEFSTPSANSFNLRAGTPLSYSSGKRYNFPVLFLPSPHLTLASIPIFSSPEGEALTANLTIFTPARQILARSKDIDVILTPNKNTHIVGAFLSNFFESPVVVEHEWGGEIVIEN